MHEPQQQPRSTTWLTRRRGRVVLVGAGNIGSHVAMELVNRTGIESLTIIDRDTIELRNCRNQAYAPHDAGKPKAEVLARRVTWIESQVAVNPIVADLADVPLGVLADANVILAGLDSLAARQLLHADLAYRLGTPSIDGAVDGTGGTTGRVQVFVPGQACLECAFGDDHYRQLSHEMPCTPDGTDHGLPNQATAELGAAVARRMVDQAIALLQAVPRQSYAIDFDLHSGRQFTSQLCRAAGCRFDHHSVAERVNLTLPFASATVAELIESAQSWAGSDAVEVEHRRGLFGSPRRRSSATSRVAMLQPYAGQTLADVGLDRRDWILLRTPGRHAFLQLDTNTVTPGPHHANLHTRSHA
ncbi:MAG: ThiF family adenylyltransferase [Pirellulales bacterium]|nr:ThiF family adenylyltransferase [Pirellulales bacterium]